MTEEWRPMPGGDGLYAISNFGRVKRLKAAPGTQIGSIVKPAYLRGYARYNLRIKKRGKMFSAHRSVYEAFVGQIPEGMQINHKNGIKDDNRVENLEVVTASENKLHAHRVLGVPGNCQRMLGEKNGRAKLSWDLVRSIRQRYADGGISQQALAHEYGLDQTNISRLIRGDTWCEHAT